MITGFDKAIAAVIVPFVVLLLAHFGFNMDQTWADALAAVIAGIVVYLVPNKEPAA